jgi:hypothetical protein
LIAVSLLFNNRPITTGLIVGSILSIVLFVSLWWTITVIFRKKEGQRPVETLFAVLVFVFKLPVVGVAMYFAFRYLNMNLFALVAGIGVTQIAIVCLGTSNLFKKRRAPK